MSRTNPQLSSFGTSAFPVAVVLLSLLFINACKRFEPEGFLHVNTGSVSAVGVASAQCDGEVTDDGGEEVTARGVCWGTSSEPGISGSRTTDGSGTGSFTSSITGLNPATAYFVRAYATSSDGTTYGEERTFTTLAPGMATVTTKNITDVTVTSALSGGTVTDDGGVEVTARGVCWSTIPAPTLSDGKTLDGAGEGDFTSHIAGLSPNTIYYTRAYATNSVGTSYGNELTLRTYAGSVSDYEGNFYYAVKIGEQTWMATNVKSTRYADGSAIPLKESSAAWAALGPNDRAYCWYAGHESNKDIYGGLYTWAAAMNGNASSWANPSGIQGICPEGWHLPSDEEWKQLEMHLGMSQSEADSTGWRGAGVGGKLKEAGTLHWVSPNTEATNESGFTALPAGGRWSDGPFGGEGESTIFWSSTEWNDSTAFVRFMSYNMSSVNRYSPRKKVGASVRCVEGE